MGIREVINMELNGAGILIESLKREGVDTIFGIPGGALVFVCDVLHEDSDMRFILMRHEQAATHAADAYGRVTGKPGVCMVTSGPGATNTVTGIATAYMDSAPLVVISGQVNTNMIGSDAFQEADITGIARPITKHSYLIKDVDDIARTVKEAIHIAETGRPGPVLIDFPKDVSMAMTEYVHPETVNIRGYRPNYEGHIQQIKKVAQAIAESERPLLYLGGGAVISGADRELFELAEKANIPVTTTLLALGSFPADHPLNLGMPGMHGTQYANLAFSECDLIIAVGARFDDRVTGKLDAFAPTAKIAHLDIDPAAISKNVTVHIPVVGDARQILTALNPLVQPRPRSAWNDRIDELKRQFPLTYSRDDKLINPQYVIQQMSEAAQGEVILATDVGQHQMWSAQYFSVRKPRTFLTSGGLGTMGYGFPAAIGAQVARPDASVLLTTGDGSFQMNIQELATVVQEGLPVKVAILNNGYLGMVRQWQEMFFDKRYSTTCLGTTPEFVRVAEAYGVHGMRVTEASEVRPAIEDALAKDGPVVMEFMVREEENVFPMVPAGKPLTEMIVGLA